MTNLLLGANGLLPGFDLWDDRTAFALGPDVDTGPTRYNASTESDYVSFEGEMEARKAPYPDKAQPASSLFLQMEKAPYPDRAQPTSSLFLQMRKAPHQDEAQTTPSSFYQVQVLQTFKYFNYPFDMQTIVMRLEVPGVEITNYSLLTTHYSLLTTHYSLLTTHYLRLTTHYSLFTTHYSLRTTHYALLTTHY